MPAFLNIDLEPVISLGAADDAAYLELLKEMVIDHEVMQEEAPQIVFSPIHGTGAISSVPALKALGVKVIEVPEQMVQDARFPTVQVAQP